MTDPRDNVIEIASADRERDAWDAYIEMARRLRDEPALLCDKPFHEELQRRHRRWAKLFNIGEGAS